MVTIWSGSIASIPAGFVLCDGENGTPDLRSKFVYGTGAEIDVGQSAGAATHIHTASQSSHSHDMSSGDFLAAGSDYDDYTSSENKAITVNAGSTIPPSIKLAYIMKT